MANWWDTKKRSGNYATGMDVLNYDIGNLVSEANHIMNAGADYFHFDVQDGHYGPMISVGSPVVEGVRKHFPSKIIICHMLVNDPERFIDQFKEAGCDCFLFQLETVTDEQAKSLVGKIKEAGMKAGVALSQECEVSRLEGLVKDVDLVHISCGDPCHDDVPFNPEMLEKVAAVRKMHKKILIEIEGNVTSDDVMGSVKKGANLFVSGYQGEKPDKEFLAMRQIINKIRMGL